ncbi:hypothetical protein SAMN05880582_10249 [Rhizobium sp. RU20A]|nr:hypothetical protein SAMN05880582_10249 [Rhizobium sp. RU20A]
MKKTLLHALLSASLALPMLAGAAFADTGRLNADEIRRDIVGRTIYLAAPIGGEFPLNYRTNGVVDGDGEALGLGKFIAPKDKGKWWIDGNRLCQQFNVWYDGAPMCFELSRTEPGKVKWVRDNGQTGVARIGN